MESRQADDQINAGMVVKEDTAHHPGVPAEQVTGAHLRRCEPLATPA
jgi:hypothetical protein